MDKLLFGTAGIPARSKQLTILGGIEAVRKLGLDVMELEFVRSVNITEEKTKAVGDVAKENKIVLTSHGQYYINLNAVENSKVTASKERIIKAASIAGMCGAYSVCFHAGYYLGKSKEEVYGKVRDAIKEVVRTVRDKGLNIWIRPELTGKRTQIGELDELIRLSKDIEGVLPCIDFGHLHSRDNGRYNSYSEWMEVLAKIERELGREALDNMHIHIAGIKYSQAGELCHLNLDDSDLRYLELVRAWKEFKIKGVVISESPNIEHDALMLKRIYNISSP